MYVAILFLLIFLCSFLFLFSTYFTKSTTKNKPFFPLLRLPTLAIEEVLKFLDPIDLVNLAKSSSKCEKIIRYYSTWSNYLVSIEISDCFYVTVRRASENKEKHLRRFYNPRDEFNGFWQIEGISENQKNNLEFMMDLMNAHIDTIFFAMDRFKPSETKNVIDWLENISPSIRFASLNGQCLPPEVVEHFFEHIEVTEYLNWYLDNRIGLIFIPKGLKYFYVPHGQWITIEKLVEMDAAEIRIMRACFSSRDLNVFLKKWIRLECHLNLRLLILATYPGNFEEILEGIDRVEAKALQYLEEADIELDEGGVEITRSDGMKARIFVIEDDVANFMVMVVK